jgi:hypothetical protein
MSGRHPPAQPVLPRLRPVHARGGISVRRREDRASRLTRPCMPNWFGDGPRWVPAPCADTSRTPGSYVKGKARRRFSPGQSARELSGLRPPFRSRYSREARGGPPGPRLSPPLRGAGRAAPDSRHRGRTDCYPAFSVGCPSTLTSEVCRARSGGSQVTSNGSVLPRFSRRRFTSSISSPSLGTQSRHVVRGSPLSSTDS